MEVTTVQNKIKLNDKRSEEKSMSSYILPSIYCNTSKKNL